MQELLQVKNLRVHFPTRSSELFEAVRGISFSVGRERVGIVGESGSGKTMTGRAILRLIQPPGQVTVQQMQLGELDLAALTESQMRRIRGARISMVMQDPKFSLNPAMRVGDQIAESYRAHANCSRTVAQRKTIEMLDAVQIRNPERVSRLYPHEVSGGMGQRIMIAMMLAPDPDLLIADEPTSALDVTVRLSVLRILDDLVRDRGMGLIFIRHDLNLVATFCDRIIIMYAGRTVETCAAGQLSQSRHPYTQGSLNALPRLDQSQPRLAAMIRNPDWMSAPSVSAFVS